MLKLTVRSFVKLTSLAVATAALSSALPLWALHAQGAQKYGLQVAALATSIGSGDAAIAGAGTEVQLRANRLYASEKFALSVGMGGQFTSHTGNLDKITIAGVFVEPRWVPATRFTRVFPYISGRLALLRQSSNFGSASTGPGYGAGAGVGLRLARAVNLDAGVALVRQQFGDFVLETDSGPVPGAFVPFTTYAAKVGLSFGFPIR